MGVGEIMAVGLLVLFALVLGVKIGQATAKGKDIEWAEIKPMEAIKERKEKREAEHEQERMRTILSNIESYDGTSVGQKEVK